MDEQFGGAAALSLVALAVVGMGAILLNRSGASLLWVSAGLACVAVVAVAVALEARRL